MSKVPAQMDTEESHKAANMSKMQVSVLGQTT